MFPPDDKQSDISIVVPVLSGGTDPTELYRLYAPEVEKSGRTWQFVFVVDGPQNCGLDGLRQLIKDEPLRVVVLVLSKPHGEAAALTVGFGRATGDTIVTLGATLQTEPAALGEILQVLESTNADLVVGRRYPRKDGTLARTQSWAFHWIVRVLTSTPFRDLSCGLRAMRRQLAHSLNLYGDLHRFIPVLAQNEGFDVREVAVEQSASDRPRGLYGPAAYSRRLLDSLSLFFLVRFTQRPLRFFGMIGIALFAAGSVITAYLGLYRILGLGGIADKPLLLLGLLLVVTGIQSISIGLLGELIIFAHGRSRRSYRIAEVLEGSGTRETIETD